MSPVSTFRRACGTISYSVMGSTARISSTPDVTPPLQRLTRLPSLSHPLPLVFGAHPILNSGCSVSCIAFCLPRVPSLLESLHLALVVFFLLLVVRAVLCPFSIWLFSISASEFPIAMRKITGEIQISARCAVSFAPQLDIPIRGSGRYTNPSGPWLTSHPAHPSPPHTPAPWAGSQSAS